ncbi:NAD(P)/FAD-dependent oxidoreductase [Paraburkholderia sp.]|jgi:thioredoxin reductase (NADPH)|uniref:NAD(P)/FAD-dependent oxidoreductase n=1 Tax=Paraburkholderia sp. TaxID=1926495 RepID=UPI002F42EA67
MSDPSSGIVDCAIVGGGPAGLTAALYLARFRRSVVVIDAGESRAGLIPMVRNLCGFESGIAGHVLIDKVRRQVMSYDVPFYRALVTAARVRGDAFEVSYQPTESTQTPLTLRARRVLAACGIRDRLPPLADAAALTQRGLLRLCPICDGYEAHDKCVAIFGPAKRALSHALFFRTFARQVAVVASDMDSLGDDERRAANERSVHLVTLGSIATPGDTEDKWQIKNVDGDRYTFDAVYPVMGCTPQAAWFDNLSIAQDATGMIVTDKHQRTSVDGLYAAGDLVNSLNQISVAAGEGAVAASSIHSSLPPNPL